MSLGKRLIQTGVAACLTETTDIFGGSTGKALYSMDYDASDTSGVYDGTPSNVDFGVGGQINTGARFNGSSSQISLPTSLVNSQNTFTVSFWAKTQTNTDYSYLFSFGQTVDTDGFGLARASNSAISGGLDGNGLAAKELYLNTGSSFIGANFTIEDDTMYHFAVSYTGTTVKIYVNGNLIQTYTSAQNIPSLAIPASGNNAYIGRYIGTAYNWNGTIDQFRVFHSILSDSQVSTLAAEQACVHTSTTDDINFPVTNAAYYKLDNSAEDSKGTAEGTETDIEYRFGRYGQAAIFNGSSSRINLPVGLGTTGARSNSLWIKVDTFPSSSIETFFYIGTQGANENYETLSVSSTSKVKFQQRVGSATDMTAIESSETIIAGNWYHIATTHDGTTAKLYINGDLSKGGSVSFSSYVNNSFLAGNLGAFHTTTPSYDGSIDQYRRFHTALSPANVLKLAEEKPETDTSNFKAVLWEGTDTSNYISSVGMDLETSGGLAWIKRTNSSEPHALYDSIRGINKQLSSDSTAIEATNSASFQGFASFEANGFFVDNNGGTNRAPNSYVGWVWKGGGAPVSNGNGSITSSVSANTAAGFSIVSFTGTGANATIGHGLSSDGTSRTPELIIFKNRDSLSHWDTYSSTIGATKRLQLSDSVGASASNSAFFNNTDPTPSVFSVGLGLHTNGSGDKMIAYCFASVAGYQKIGSYSGTGLAGNAQDVGFKPSFVIIKRTTATESWFIFDTRRPDKRLEADSSNSENTDVRFNLTSTGFDFDGNVFNESSNTYIYLAIK